MGPVGPPGPDMLLGVGKPGPQFMGPSAGPHIGPGVLDPELPGKKKFRGDIHHNLVTANHLKVSVQSFRSWVRKVQVVGALLQGWLGVQGRLHGTRGTPGSPGPAGCPKS